MATSMRRKEAYLALSILAAMTAVIAGCVYNGVSCGTFGFISMYGGVNTGSCDIQIGVGKQSDNVAVAFVRCTPGAGPAGGYRCDQMKFINLTDSVTGDNRPVPVDGSFPTQLCIGGVNDSRFKHYGCYVQDGAYRAAALRQDEDQSYWSLVQGRTYYMCVTNGDPTLKESTNQSTSYACQRFTPGSLPPTT